MEENKDFIIGKLSQGFEDINKRLDEIKLSLKDTNKKVECLMRFKSRVQGVSSIFGFISGIAGAIVAIIIKQYR
ncbi:MAG: hypothetical protein KGI72_05430 [Patescibacteria group bacterium]|nr:hypothetical protein [Patescibacteria group bacterium]